MKYTFLTLLIMLPVFLFALSKTPDPESWTLEERMLGGFRLTTTDNKNAKKSLDFAIAELAKEKSKKVELVKFHKVYQQVVAGMNYRMLVELKIDGVKEFWILQVYRDLKGKMQLTEKKRWE